MQPGYRWTLASCADQVPQLHFEPRKNNNLQDSNLLQEQHLYDAEIFIRYKNEHIHFSIESQRTEAG